MFEPSARSFLAPELSISPLPSYQIRASIGVVATRFDILDMRVSSGTTLLALVSAAWAQCVSRRPTLSPMPYSPRVPFPNPPARRQVCVVPTHGDGVTDDSAHIMSTLRECNNGGHVVFPRGETFVVGTAMDLTFLKHIDIGTCI